MILKASVQAPRELSGDGHTIGLRWADHPFLQAVLDELGTPLVSTSANISGSEPLRRPGMRTTTGFRMWIWLWMEGR